MEISVGAQIPVDFRTHFKILIIIEVISLDLFFRFFFFLEDKFAFLSR